MLNEDVRAARLAAGLSQAELARRAGIPRPQLRFLEEGGNVTIATIRKVAAVLPNLTRVSLGEVEMTTANPDLEEARRAALDLFDVAKRLVAALGAVPSPQPGGGGGTRHDSKQDHERRAKEIQRERDERARRGKSHDES